MGAALPSQAAVIRVHPHYEVAPHFAGSFTGLSPKQVKQFYGLSMSNRAGAGQTIAIVDAYDNPRAEADLNVFSKTFDLPPCTTSNGCFQKIYASGTKPKTHKGWAAEISLDVQWAHAIAPGAKIVLVEAASDAITDMMQAVLIATQTGAHQVSNSWGTDFDCPTCVPFDAFFATPGVTYLASSGDNRVVNYPATSTHVVSVGGTTLALNSSFTPKGEVAWSKGGGGPSRFELQHPLQISWYTTGSRGTPDIAANADPRTGYKVYNTFGHFGWQVVGGTSASCPIWAALVAQANAARSTPLPGNATPFYWAAGLNYAKNFKDITRGSNGHPAAPRYDLATGLGSPTRATVAALVAFPN